MHFTAKARQEYASKNDKCKEKPVSRQGTRILFSVLAKRTNGESEQISNNIAACVFERYKGIASRNAD